MIRILHNVGSLAAGGMESYIMNQYRHLDRTKVQYDFIVGDDTDYYEEEIRGLGGRVFRIHTSITAPFKFYKFLKKHNEYQIVHSHRDAMSTLYLIAAKCAGIKVRISHSHNTSRQGIANVVANILKPILPYITTDRFACGKEAGIWLYGKSSFRIISNAIDCEKYQFNVATRQKVRSELGIGEETVVIGHVGRFEEQKNHRFLLDIFKDFSTTRNNIVLLCVGSGSQFESIKKYSLQLGIQEKCIFLGNRNDVYRLLQAMDLILFPSLYEGFSIAMLEFQAAGLPIICSDTIPKEINICGNTYFYTLSESATQWSTRMGELIESPIKRDFEGFQKIKNAGYDIKTSTQYIQDYYLSYKQK